MNLTMKTIVLIYLCLFAWPALLLGQSPYPTADDHHAHFHAPGSPGSPGATLTHEAHIAFAKQVNLAAIRKISVFEGRQKILDTFAREELERLYGKPAWKNLLIEKSKRYDPVFTFFDLLFNKAYYLNKPVIYIEVLPLREAMLSSLQLSPEEAESWKQKGRLTPAMFMDPRLQPVFQAADADARLLKGRNQFMGAWQTFENWGAMLHLISPTPGDDHWLTLAEIPGTDPQAAPLRQLFAELGAAWVKADAPTVNAKLDQLATLLPQVHPTTYPPAWRGQLEYVYNVTKRLTIGYVAYALAVIVLLLSLAIGRRGLIFTGVGLLLLGVAIHFAGMVVRTILAQRWPIHNQYESFIAISFFGVVVGIVIMFLKRQWLFGVAASALGAAALLFANTVDIPSSDVSPVAGILATSRILYLHVNLVLASYSLIGLGFFLSLFYLATYYFQDAAIVGLMSRSLRPPMNLVAENASLSSAVNCDATTLKQTSDDSNVISDGADNLSPVSRTLLDLDKAQMVVLQLAFWILGVGILLGAYWADHAWGRWWAWDPKETWALITWIVYLIVIHVRITSNNRGLVTAWLSIIGFIVMLWTYWGVNLLLAGLHSYA